MNNTKRFPFTNDYVFKRVLSSNKEITKEIIKIITGNDVTIEQLNQQQEIKSKLAVPSVRYDIYLLTNQNEIYDIEMQTYNHHNLALRSRYYVSSNDIDYENKYRDRSKKFLYYDLPAIYIIFICTFDPFNLNELVYEAEEGIKIKGKFLEDQPPYDTKIKKIYVNTAKVDSLSYNESANKELVNLLAYINSNIPNDKLTNEINKCVNIINERESEEIMTYQDHFDEMEEYFRREGKEEGLKEGIEKGIAQGSKETRDKALIDSIKFLKPYCPNLNELFDKLNNSETFKDYSFKQIEDIYNTIN